MASPHLTFFFAYNSQTNVYLRLLFVADLINFFPIRRSSSGPSKETIAPRKSSILRNKTDYVIRTIRFD
jgi:hypothetical protein